MTLDQQLLAAAQAVPTWNWVLVLLGILLPIPVAYFPHAKQAYHQWRLDRRLIRDPIIYQDELNDYEYDIGEDLNEVEWRDILWNGIGSGLLMAGFFVLQKLESEWTLYFVFASATAAVAFGIWRHSRDVETAAEDPYFAQPAEYPPEAKWGLLAGLSLTFVIVMLAIEFF